MTGGEGVVMMSGTSQAAAYVSGAAAVFLSDNPNATPDQVREAIVSSGHAEIQGVPTNTTNKTVRHGSGRSAPMELTRQETTLSSRLSRL